MVNSRPADIFNGILEPQKSRENTEKSRENRLRNAAGRRVYHVGVYYNGAAGEANGLLKL